MTNLQIIIDTLHIDLLGATTVGILLKKLSDKGINLTKRQLLTCYVRKTLRINKPEKKKDILLYVDKPKLPEKYSDLTYNFRVPEDMEDLFFLFVFHEKYIPAMSDFKKWYDSKGYKFLYDWTNRNNFHSMKKKICNVLRDCNQLPE